MRLLRRIFVAVFLAGFSAAIMRLRGTGGTPPQHGGWKPLELPAEAPGGRRAVDPSGVSTGSHPSAPSERAG